jgi:hypothetical protein
MADIFVKPRINKSNNQVNFSIPKRKLSKDIYKKIKSLKGIKLDESSWLFE